MGKLLAVITVGCDGRSAPATRTVLAGETLLARAVRMLVEVAPECVVASLPTASLRGQALAAGVEPLVRPAGADSLEEGVDHALGLVGHGFSHVLAVDPLLPLRRPGRLAAALRLAVREGADCVFSCHRESALLWQRSPMGLVPYFDPTRRPGVADGDGVLPWLKEDGGFYLLSVAAFRRDGHRHAGRIAPLEIEPEEAVMADSPSGLAVCRALLAEPAGQTAGA
ncbi:MAG: hypothetical protein R3D98_03355 [Candidatus Krumholzibacteriia bacterium]